MKRVITGYEPDSLFGYFEEISAIPRGSGNEKGIADYLVAFAEERGLFSVRDSLNNVLIRKPASPGFEDRPAILLQGHTDMVCEQNAGTGHDFEKDGLELYVEDGWLKARGTTLGGDDGVAVAIMLNALADDTLAHPELECLFTTGEETGLYGAVGFDHSLIRAKKLINLDSEEEGVATVSCAGGIGFDFRFVPDRLPIADVARPLSVTVSGLVGGHSGEDIIKERGNADILLTRALSALYEMHPFHIVTIGGGTRGNAIPREASAVILTSEPEAAISFLRSYEKVLREWLPREDREFRLRAEKAKGDHPTMLSLHDTSRILTLTALMPNGVMARMLDVPDMVQTSNNLGVIRDEGEQGILIVYHGRSALDSKMDAMASDAKRLASMLGFSLDVNGRYSGWPMRSDSRLAEAFLKAARAVYSGLTPRLIAIHAGLECGIFCGAIEGLDAISIGPTLENIHSPGEKLELGSLARLWDVVVRLLKAE